MSVHRKALWAAVLAGTFVGCAVKQPTVDTNYGDTNYRESIGVGESERGGGVDGVSKNAGGDHAGGDNASASVTANALAEEDTGGSHDSVASLVPTAEPVILESVQIASAKNSNIGVRIERGDGFSRLLLSTKAKQPQFDVTTLTQPARLVIDFSGEKVVKNKRLEIPKDAFVQSVRIGSHGNLSRVVLDLTKFASDLSQVNYVVDTKENAIAVTFHDLSIKSTQEKEVSISENLKSEISAGDVVVKDMAVKDTAASQEVTAKRDIVEQGRPLVIKELALTKTKDSSGEVFIGFDKAVDGPFALSKTAPSEFVLTIPDAIVDATSARPQIAPLGFPGIRSARAVQDGKNATIRMFVDAGIDLVAQPSNQGIEVIAKQDPLGAGKNPNARAQFEQGDQAATEDGKLTGAAPKIAKSPFQEDETSARAHPTGVESEKGEKIYTGRLISLDLQDTDIDNALRIIAEVSNLNIIASEDVTGKVTLRLIDVPWDQALDVILRTNGLDSVTEGNVIRIAPVDKLRQEREALQAAENARRNLEPLKVRYIRVSYARVSDMKEQVEAVLSERGSVAVDERTNQLIIKDIGVGQIQSEELIKRLDLRTPQVLLETQIVESTRSLLRDLGFQWNFSYIQSPETGNATGQNFPNSINISGSGSGGNAVDFPAVLDGSTGSAVTALFTSVDGSKSLAARLTALETEGKARVVSRPQVATVNNKQAEIKSVETIRVRLPDSGLSVATGSGASASGGGSSAFEEILVGITLTVTPQAAPDYFVLLDVKAKSSTFGSHPPVDNIPSTFERQATSTILVKSGQTFALGGVYRIRDDDRIQGVPFLKDIPVLGHFFRRSLIDKNDEELIFFITPHIVEGSFDESLMDSKEKT